MKEKARLQSSVPPSKKKVPGNSNRPSSTATSKLAAQTSVPKKSAGTMNATVRSSSVEEQDTIATTPMRDLHIDDPDDYVPVIIKDRQKILGEVQEALKGDSNGRRKLRPGDSW